MKAFLFYAASLSFIIIFLPALVVGGWWRWETNAVQTELPPQEEAFPPEEIILKIYDVRGEKLMEIEVEEYLQGVVAAEMPASFHPEALKAQAVVARTYALGKLAEGEGGGCQSFRGVHLCTGSACCQAWEGEKDALEKWPPGEALAYLERIRQAVNSTRGLVAVYQGSLISAVYHSTCGGKTEEARQIWSGGPAHPYLQSVDCPYCRHSPHYEREVVLDFATYRAALADHREILPALAQENIPFLSVLERSKSGRNLLVKIGSAGPVLKGSEVRELLRLPSTFFQQRLGGEKVVFITRGYGHGVGMCQYGADGMAREGRDFREILQYYFQGIEVVDYRSLSGGQKQKAPPQGPEASYQPAVAPADMLNPSDF